MSNFHSNHFEPLFGFSGVSELLAPSSCGSEAWAGSSVYAAVPRHPVAVLSIVHALGAVARLDDELLKAASKVLSARATELDATASSSPVQAKQADIQQVSTLASEPGILYDDPLLCVLWKPPGWGVSVSNHHSQEEMRSSDEDDMEGGFLRKESQLGGQLQQWVAQHLGPQYPICNDRHCVRPVTSPGQGHFWSYTLCEVIPGLLSRAAAV